MHDGELARVVSHVFLAQTHARRIEFHHHGHAEGLLVTLVFDTDRAHLPNGHTAEIDWRTWRQAAHGLIEVEHCQRGGEFLGLLHGFRLVRRKQELRVLGGRGVRGRVLRRLEGQAAKHHGDQRLRGQLQPVRVELEVDAAGMPEARIGGDELVIGLVDEDPQRDVVAVRLELIRYDMADLHATIVDR